MFEAVVSNQLFNAIASCNILYQRRRTYWWSECD